MYVILYNFIVSLGASRISRIIGDECSQFVIHFSKELLFDVLFRKASIEMIFFMIILLVVSKNLFYEHVTLIERLSEHWLAYRFIYLYLIMICEMYGNQMHPQAYDEINCERPSREMFASYSNKKKYYKSGKMCLVYLRVSRYRRLYLMACNIKSINSALPTLLPLNLQQEHYLKVISTLASVLP